MYNAVIMKNNIFDRRLTGKKFINYFKNYDYNFLIVDIYHKNNIANNCIVIIRKNV